MRAPAPYGLSGSTAELSSLYLGCMAPILEQVAHSCWYCQHYGGLSPCGSASKCLHPRYGATIASPLGGCAFLCRVPGIDDEWLLPAGFCLDAISPIVRDELSLHGVIQLPHLAIGASSNPGAVQKGGCLHGPPCSCGAGEARDTDNAIAPITTVIAERSPIPGI